LRKICYNFAMKEMKELIKTDIDLLRGLIFAFLGALFSVSGFLFISRKSLDYYEIGFLVAILVALSVVLCLCFWLYAKQRKELKDLLCSE
jgi:heme/copper-type cytochrome/quinol oxidase subunit 4